jgi:hypothetical protein
MARLKLTKTRTQRLTDALIADRTRTDDAMRHKIVACRSCGSTFIYKGRRSDLNCNFCSLRSQDWYDAGNAPIEHDHIVKANKTPNERWRIAAGPPGVEVGAPYYASVFSRSQRSISMTMTEKGYRIRCAHCRKEFESLGLRCCSADCERRYREAQNNRAAMAEVGIEPAAKRRCENPECVAVIPKWRNGRKVSSATRFCSPRCSRKAAKLAAPMKCRPGWSRSRRAVFDIQT